MPRQCDVLQMCLPALASILVAGAMLSAQDAIESSSSPVAASPLRLPTEHLPNAIRIHPKILSGGLPEGESAFQELKSLGVRTLISVDHMKPDLATAKSFGMRYVHLPHGYDGIPANRAVELAKAVRELKGPIYIHCHHGKHRSPAAASVACISAGLIPKTMGLAILQFAGTDPSYRGLFLAAQNATPIDTVLLESLDVSFPESARVPAMAEAMVELSHTHEKLQEYAESNGKWQVHLADSPHTHVVLLREHFTELLRIDDVSSKPPAFRNLLVDSLKATRQLETMLQPTSDSSYVQTESGLLPIRASMLRIATNCQTCHQQFRDLTSPPNDSTDSTDFDPSVLQIPSLRSDQTGQHLKR